MADSFKSGPEYPGEVHTRSLVNKGVELPIPYQIEMMDAFHTRLDDRAWDKLVMKSFQRAAQPVILHRPVAKVAAPQGEPVASLLDKIQAIVTDMKANDLPGRGLEASPTNTPPSSMQTCDSFTQHALVSLED